MTTFDMEDPLGDLLSDGDNDSFFENPKPKGGSFRKSSEKKSVSELFGLELDKPTNIKKETTKAQDDWLGISSKPFAATSEINSTNLRPQTAKQTKKISFENDNDLFSSMGLDAKNSVLESSAKANTRRSDFMDDLFGSSRPKLDESKSGGLFDDLMPTRKTDGDMGNSDMLDTAKVVEQSFVLGDKPPAFDSAGRESRRSRTPLAANLDPLGLLGSSSNENVSESQMLKPKSSPVRRRTPPTNQDGLQILPDRPKSAKKVEVVMPLKDVKTKSAPNITDLPDWLGGAKVKAIASEMSLDKIDDTNHQQAIIQTPSTQNLSVQSGYLTQITPEASQMSIPLSLAGDNSMFTQQKLTSASIEYQNTAIALQQQESQVLMALQLQKYENSMAEMQRQQHELLVKQEQSFNILLDKQFAKQQMIENNIRFQQERINNHIQLLVNYPAKGDKVSENNENAEFESIKNDNKEELKTLYEAMIAILKERHKEEMHLLEESYKKQIVTLEQSMEAIESRLKQDLDYMTLQNSTKIEALKDEHASDILFYKNKIEEIQSAHKLELSMLRENQNRIIDEVKYEHNTILESMKQSRNTNSAIVDDAGSYSQKLDVSLKLLEMNSRNIQEMQDNVDKKYGILTIAREETLKVREEEIRLMRLALDKAREEANTDRAQLMNLVRTLELKLSQQSQDSREERYALQQATALISARSAALERDAEFNRSCLDREREQLKTLREQLLTEQEQSILSLNEEKLAISAERAKLEISRKLSLNSFSEQRTRAEVEAAVQVAKEAAEMADMEREQLQRRITEVEAYKRTLGDKERKMQAKERELDALQRSAESRGKEGEEALMEAQLLRSSHNQRLKELQKQLKSLSLREKRLTEEKISLSKERLSLHTLNKRTKRCSLCRVEETGSPDRNSIGIEEGPIADDDESIVEHDNSPTFIGGNDAEMFRMQLKQSEDQLISNHNIQDEDEISSHN